MNQACNPRQKKGERNVFCPLYNRCLNHAIKESWEYFACSDCRNKLNQGSRPEIPLMAIDLIEHYDLRLEI
jgi:hypothetical protein